MSFQPSDQTVSESDFETALLVPPFKQGYSVIFGTLDFYVVIKRIVMIYERFVIARK